MDADARTWWARPGLEIREGRFLVAGRDAEGVAREHGTPLYVYDLMRVEEQARALAGAFARASLSFRLRLALKAQRDPRVLAFVRDLRFVGIDACSPGEVLHALDNGWPPEEVSFTGTNVSERDLDVLLAHPIHINVDLLSQLDRLGRRAPGTRVGIRVNPRQGAAAGSGPRSSASSRSSWTGRSPSLAHTTSRSTPCTSTWATGS